MVKKSQHYLFHDVLKKFRSISVQNKALLCAVSGGMDSMSLLSLLVELKNTLNLKISVVHVHHHSTDKVQRNFQDKAQRLVKSYCTQQNIDFYSPVLKKDLLNITKKSKSLRRQKTIVTTSSFCSHSQILTKKISNNNNHIPLSEAQMRTYRYKIFSQVFKDSKSDFLVLAHTADDLLETRLIRLIRGTGELGLSAMFLQKKKLLRPLIQINRSQIKDFALQTHLKWYEDPSNLISQNNLRNWVRHKWLKLLEEHRPGSLKALSRSLTLLSQNTENQLERTKKLYQHIHTKKTLQRNLLTQLPVKDRARILAYYMHKQKLKNYSQSHIQEILKRLKKNEKNTQFQLLGKIWEMNPYKIFIKRGE